MTLLRPIFALIASWPAGPGLKASIQRKLITAACENSLVTGELIEHEDLSKYDLFLNLFRNWRRDGDEMVGAAGDLEWRVSLARGRMTFAFREREGMYGQLSTARRVAEAALVAFTPRDGLTGFAVAVEGERVVARLPLNPAGLRFVVSLTNEAEGFTAFRPIARERRNLDATATERGGQTHFSYTVRTEPAHAEMTWRGVSAWLAHQDHLRPPAGVSFDPLGSTFAVDLDGPRGLKDVVANGRRVAKVALELARRGLGVDVSTTVLDDDRVRVTLPWSPRGLLFHNALVECRAAAGYDQPVVVPGLTEAERAAVLGPLEGLAPRVLFVRHAPEHFLTAPAVALPTAEALEAERQRDYAGEVLPAEMLFHRTLEFAEIYYAYFNPWNTTARGVWTAARDGVTLAIRREGGGSLSLDFGGRADGRARVESILASLARTGGRMDFADLRVSADRTRLEIPLGPRATRLIVETREALAAVRSTVVVVAITPPLAAE